MKTLRTLLQVPVLVLIVYLGAISGYQLIRDVQGGGFHYYDWRSYAYIALGALEVAVLICVYRHLGSARTHQLPQSDSTNSR